MARAEVIEKAFTMFLAQFYGPISMLRDEKLTQEERAALAARLEEARRYIDRLAADFAAPETPPAAPAPELFRFASAERAAPKIENAAERREIAVYEALMDDEIHGFQELWDAVARAGAAPSSPAALVTQLARMDQKGAISRPRRGDYCITEEGRKRLAALRGK